MYKVDVIMTGTLDSIIGPVQTIKRIRNNRDFFLDNGFDISIFTSDNLPKSTAAKIRESKSNIVKQLKVFSHKLSKKSWIYSWYRVRHFFTSCDPLLNFYQAQNRKPDMIVFHSLMDCYEYLKHYRIEGVKIACFTHSDGLLFKMLLMYYPRLIGGRIDKKLMGIAEYVMQNVDVKPCIARIEEKNLLEKYDCLRGKTCLVINAIDDLSTVEKQNSQKIREQLHPFRYRFVCTGSVQRRKGQYNIVTVLNEIPDNILKNIHLTIVGDGPDKPIIEDYLSSHTKLLEHVELLGSVKNSEVYKVLAKNNIMILMSENEGLPIALIEGLRSGLALVSTNVSGIPELINENINGKLLNPNNDELENLLVHIDDYNWEMMGCESRKMFEKYYIFTRMREDYLHMLMKGLCVDN